MHDEPLVSIVIPVYNGSKYVIEAIESALNQTYRNIEVIVIDDGSNDEGRTQRVISFYKNSVKIISQENRGCGGALNAGIYSANGSLISWLSHDDVYRTDKIENQVSLFLNSDSANTIIWSGWKQIDSSSRTIGMVDPASIVNEPEMKSQYLPIY